LSRQTSFKYMFLYDIDCVCNDNDIISSNGGKIKMIIMVLLLVIMTNILINNNKYIFFLLYNKVFDLITKNI